MTYTKGILLRDVAKKRPQKAHSFFLHTTYEEEKKSVGAMGNGQKLATGTFYRFHEIFGKVNCKTGCFKRVLWHYC